MASKVQLSTVSRIVTLSVLMPCNVMALYEDVYQSLISKYLCPHLTPPTQSQTQGRGRIIFSVERAFRFRSILNEFVAEFQRLPPAAEEVTESERIKTYALLFILSYCCSL